MNFSRGPSMDQIARMDRNLSVIRDKIEDAERVSGKTRSQLLNMLDLRQSDGTAMDPEKANDLLELKKFKKKNGKIEISYKDLLSLQSLMDRINFVLLKSAPRKTKKETMLA